MKLPRFISKNKGLLAAVALSAILVTGCGDSLDDFVFANNAQQAPTATNDAVTALGNATLNQATANGVLANDAANGAGIVAFDAVGTRGGAVVLNADGSFTYTPPFNFKGVDTFTYTLGNNLGVSTATVTLNVNNAGWFVDNSGANGNGSQATPFNNLNDALNAATNGDTIFVYRGDGTTNNQAGDFNLPLGVNLIGQGAGLVLAQTIEPAGLAPVIEGTIMPAGGNTISGFIIDVDDDDDDGIEANGITNLTISNNTFRNGENNYIDLDNSGGTVNITDNTFEPIGDDEEFVFFDNTDTNATLNINNNTFTDDGTSNVDDGVQIEIRGTSVVTLMVDNNTFSSNDLLSDNIEDALLVDVEGTAQAMVTVSNNTFTNVETAIDLDTENNGASLTGTISGNMITGTSDNGIEADASGGTVNLTITGNILDQIGSGSIDTDADAAGGDITIVATNNTVTNTTGDHAFELEVSAGATGATALRNNTFTGSNNFSVNIVNDGTTCADVTGNTVDDDMNFTTNAGTFNLERMTVATGGPLTAVNTFTAGVVQLTGAVTAQNAGFCNIP